MPIRSVLVVVGVLAALPLWVDAHHSTAMYDDDHPIDVHGVITRIEWTSPHAVVFVTSARNGAPVEWRIELDPPPLLEQHGWGERTLHIGDAITFTGAPAKSGAAAMRGLGAILGDGTQLRTWSRP